jgi:imidazolonepropionase-like amidohydrolase
VAGDDDIANRVRRNKSAGADLIKVMASGGALTPGGPPMWAAQFNRDQLRHIVRTAAEHQLPVAAHAHGTDTIADCVLAGVRTIEHCSWRAERGFHYDHDLAAEIVARDIAVCRCVSGDWRRFLQQLGPNAEALIDTIMRMREAGVRFIAGTDAGVPGATFRDYAGMLEFFIELGFTAAEVLDMATVHPAHALDLGEVGGLRPGLRADIIVVDGDPLTDIRALHGPRLVMTRGRLFDSQPR